MLDRVLIAEREDRRDREQREWQERMAKENRDWQEGQGRSRLRWEIIVFGLIVTLALVASQIAAAFIARDSVVVEPSQVRPPDIIVEPQIIIDDSILPAPDTQEIQSSESP